MSTDPKGFTRKWMLANHNKPAPFKKDLFETIFSSENLQKNVENLKNSIDIELFISSRIIADDFYFNIEVFSHKHPHVPINLNRITLPHSCHNEDSNILIFVKDVKMANGKTSDHEASIKHYEKMFRTNGVDQSLITFMPVSKLFNDYAGFEERRKLAFMYDQFIVDRDVAVKVNAFLGNKLINDGRAAFPIDFSDQSSLAEKVQQMLSTVFCMYSQPIPNVESKCVIRIGRQSMSNEQIVENIVDLLHQLQHIHPGGCNNVRKLIIRANSNPNVGKAFRLFVDKSKPTYPEEDETKDTAEQGDTAMETSEAVEDSNETNKDMSRLLQKIYVHTSIIGSDSIIPDKEDYAMNDVRRDNAQVNDQPSNNQAASPKPPTLSNIEPHLMKVLKQLIAKTSDNNSVGPAAATLNRGIRRRKVPGVGNRNGRMF